MGSGYFPKVLSALILIFGLASIVRGVVLHGEPIHSVQAKPLLLISLACILFGLLLPRAGLIVALVALVLVSAAASRNFRFDARALAGLAALIAVCALVFVKGLGVPMPLLGAWLEPVLGSALPWLR